jgi:hypothetical protein
MNKQRGPGKECLWRVICFYPLQRQVGRAQAFPSRLGGLHDPPQVIAIKPVSEGLK